MKKLVLTICFVLSIQILMAQTGSSKEEYCRIDLITVSSMGKPSFTIAHVKPNGEVVANKLEIEKGDFTKGTSEWIKLINRLGTEGWIMVNTTNTSSVYGVNTDVNTYSAVLKRVL